MTGNPLRALVAVCWLPAFSVAAPLPTYVLAGQSNMSGWGQVSELSAADQAPQTDVLYHVAGGGFGYLRPTDDDFGPEIEFGRTMAAALDGPLGIVKHAVGSTSLAVSWNPEGDGNLYDQLLTRFANSRTYWTSLGYQVFVAGVVWMQGEEDARWAEMAPLYQSNLLAFIDRIRSDLDAPDAPFIFGQIRGKDYAYREVVRSAQQAVDALEVGAYLIETDDLSTYEELHFDTPALMTLGRRFATAMLGSRSETPGDADGDGTVSLSDLNAVRNNFGTWGAGDVTRDGLIAIGDLNLVRNSFGTSGSSAAVPEPAAFLLAIASVAILTGRWRRHTIVESPGGNANRSKALSPVGKRTRRRVR